MVVGLNFSEQRGDAQELFTLYPNKGYGDRMSFEIDLLLDKKIKDSWGGERELKYTRLRYFLKIKREADTRGIERLFVEKEDLRTIKHNEDTWINNKENIARKNIEFWRPKVQERRGDPYIDTIINQEITIIRLSPDEGSIGMFIPAQEVERTVLSSVNNINFPQPKNGAIFALAFPTS